MEHISRISSLLGRERSTRVMEIKELLDTLLAVHDLPVGKSKAIND
jgi:hypothetical protein